MLARALASPVLSPRRLLHGGGGGGGEQQRDYSRIYVTHACATILLFMLHTDRCGDAVKQALRDVGGVKVGTLQSVTTQCVCVQIMEKFINCPDMIDLIRAQLLVCLAYTVDECESEMLARNQRMSRDVLEQISVVLHQPADNGELCVALHLLWTLCFDEACRSRVIARDDLVQGRTAGCSHTRTLVIDVLNRLRTHADDGVRRAANGVHWLLSGRRPTASANGPQRVPHTLPTPLSTDHIMISYQWAYKDTVRTLGDALKKRAYPVWLDVEQMSKAHAHE
ncbi:unnamed protein product [Sphagnum balticum]